MRLSEKQVSWPNSKLTWMSFSLVEINVPYSPAGNETSIFRSACKQSQIPEALAHCELLAGWSG